MQLVSQLFVNFVVRRVFLGLFVPADGQVDFNFSAYGCSGGGTWAPASGSCPPAARTARPCSCSPTGSACGCLVSSQLLKHSTHLHAELQNSFFWKHSQYFFRQFERLQVQPFLVGATTSGSLALSLRMKALGFLSSVCWMAWCRNS